MTNKLSKKKINELNHILKHEFLSMVERYCMIQEMPVYEFGFSLIREATGFLYGNHDNPKVVVETISAAVKEGKIESDLYKQYQKENPESENDE